MYCSKIAAKIKEISLSFNVNGPLTLRLVTFPHISYLLLTYLYKIFLFLTKKCFSGNVILVYWYEQKKTHFIQQIFPIVAKYESVTQINNIAVTYFRSV